MSFVEELKEEWVKAKKILAGIDPEKQKDLYKAQLDRVNEIEKRLMDYSRTELEVEERAAGRDMDEALKQQQMEDEKKDRKHRTIIEWAKVIVPTAAAIGIGVWSAVWEKTDTMTSTAGKNSWRDLIKFK